MKDLTIEEIMEKHKGIMTVEQFDELFDPVTEGDDLGERL